MTANEWASSLLTDVLSGYSMGIINRKQLAKESILKTVKMIQKYPGIDKNSEQFLAEVEMELKTL